MRLTRCIDPAERDRLLQAHFAAARGLSQNGDLLLASIRLALDQVTARSGGAVNGDPLIETDQACVLSVEADLIQPQ